MNKKFSDTEFWDLVDGIGEHYKYNSRLRSEGVRTGLKIAEQIIGDERDEYIKQLLNFLVVSANRNGPNMNEIERMCGACLVLGGWGVQEALPTISRFLKSTWSTPPLAAIDSINMLPKKR